jgi:chitodextrinase
MKKFFKHFIPNTIHNIKRSLNRTFEGGRKIRYSRLRRFKKKHRRLSILAQLVAIWYLAMFAAIHFTSETGAYFNDVETISETLSAAEDFCEETKPPSDYYQKYCKDNSGGGNGPEPGDEDTGEGTDPDNPGQNPEDCDDHSNANCSENKKITEITQTVTTNSVTLTWKNPQGNQFSSISIYRNDELVKEEITSGQFEDTGLTPETTYSYKLVAYKKNENNVLTEEVIEVETSAEEISSPPEEESEGEDEESDEQPEEETPAESETETESPAETDTQAPAEVTTILSERKDNKLTLTWINPTDEDFTHVNIYTKGSPTAIKQDIKASSVQIDQKPNETITYIIKTVDSNGNESTGTLLTVDKSSNGDKENSNLKGDENDDKKNNEDY